METPSEEFILFRHGDVDRASDQIVGSGTDIPLNQDGIRQAYELAEYIKQIYGRPTLIITSPLLRAMQTSQIIANAFDKPVTICPIPAFQAQNFGILENRRVSEALLDPSVSPYLYPNIPDDKRFQAKASGGESLEDLQARIMEWFQHFAEEFSPQNVLIITHASILKALNGTINEIPPSQWEDAIKIGFLDGLGVNRSVTRAKHIKRNT